MDSRAHRSSRDCPARPISYTQVIAATGAWLVFVAGQVADDAQGHLVGPGDVAAQARQAFANVGRALAAAGAGPSQVTKITICIDHPDRVPGGYLGSPDRDIRRPHPQRTSLSLGVEALAEPNSLIEVQAIRYMGGAPGGRSGRDGGPGGTSRVDCLRCGRGAPTCANRSSRCGSRWVQGTVERLRTDTPSGGRDHEAAPARRQRQRDRDRRRWGRSAVVGDLDLGAQVAAGAQLQCRVA